MKIVINAASAKMGGAVTYLTNLLRHVPPPESGHEFLVLLPPGTAEAQKNLAPNIKLFPSPVGSAGLWKRIWWSQVTLRSFLKRQRADVLFSSANFGMFFCPIRQVLLIQNLLYVSDTYQRMFLPRHRLRKKINFRLRRRLLRWSAQAADVVMTPTEAAMEALRHYVELPASKALANPYGVSGADGGLDGPPEKRERPRSCEEPTVVLLFPSLYAEHKNLGTLLKALPLLNGSGRRKFFLRTTAAPNWMNWAVTFKDDLALAQSPDVAPRVEFIGPLGREQTLETYRHADILVFPSLVESFGYPMVEAMAAGLPIVASDTATNREICAEAAVYFRPISPEDLAHQIRQLAADGSLQAKLGAAGRERAATHFRWEEHVRRLLARVGAPSPKVVASDRAAPKPLSCR